MEIIFDFFGLKFLRSSELSTTDTEERAIASQANSGLSTIHKVENTQAATGIHSVL